MLNTQVPHSAIARERRQVVACCSFPISTVVPKHLLANPGFKTGFNLFLSAVTAVVIGPLVMFNEPGQYNYIFVKLKPGQVSETVNKLAEVCASLAPHRPFEYGSGAGDRASNPGGDGRESHRDRT